MQESLLYDVNRGTKAGPFPVPPFHHFVGSPMGAFIRKHSSKLRVVHDLSWPPGSSINTHIDETLCTLQYIMIDDAVEHVIRYGKDTLMAKLDIKNAYKHIIVDPHDWHLLGLSWPSVNGVTEYYIDLTLPFGLRSSPYLFDQFARGLQFIMESKGVTDVEHYLDDFFTCGPPNTDICHVNLVKMIEACDESGFEINPDKLVSETTSLEFLGIIIDSELMQLQISPERLSCIYDELKLWNNRKSCTKRELLSIIGKLSFICRVVKSGRTFLRRMIDLSKTAKYLHFKVKLNKEFREDIKWWLDYLPIWNGVSVIAASNWYNNIDLHLYTDSSDKGIGCIFKSDWFLVPFTGPRAMLKCQSINWRELYAIVKAIATWGELLKNMKLLMYCDNESVTYIVNSGTSRNADIMKLVRCLFYLCAHYNIDYRCEHIAGVNNTASDLLSRMNVPMFFSTMPSASKTMTMPESFLYDGMLI